MILLILSSLQGDQETRAGTHLCVAILSLLGYQTQFTPVLWKTASYLQKVFEKKLHSSSSYLSYFLESIGFNIYQKRQGTCLQLNLDLQARKLWQITISTIKLRVGVIYLHWLQLRKRMPIIKGKHQSLDEKEMG